MSLLAETEEAIMLGPMGLLVSLNWTVGLYARCESLWENWQRTNNTYKNVRFHHWIPGGFKIPTPVNRSTQESCMINKVNQSIRKQLTLYWCTISCVFCNTHCEFICALRCLKNTFFCLYQLWLNGISSLSSIIIPVLCRRSRSRCCI